MGIEKKIAVDLIEVVGNNIQVRTRTSMLEDGQEISATYHRHIVLPGECAEAEDSRVKAVCAAIHTSEVVSAYRTEQARIAAEVEAARIAMEQEAEAERIRVEQEKQADQARQAQLAAEQEATQKAMFDMAVADAVRRTLMGG